MSDLQVVTCMACQPTAHYYFWRQSMASIRRFGFEPIILGQPPYQWHWGGLGSKCKWLKRAIDERIITAKYLILTDAFDCVYAESPEKVLQRFSELNGNPIIWGAEKACFSDASLAPLHPETPSSFKYLNSGWGMGETEAFKAALDEMNPDETIKDDHHAADGTPVYENDQNMWQRQMIYGHIPIGLDTGCDLVQNLHGVAHNEIDMTGSSWRNKETGSYPMVWHANGAKEPWRDLVLTKLGLPL